MRLKKLGGAAAMILVFAMTASLAAAEELPVRISKATGTVDVKEPGATEWRPAEEGERLQAAMSVRTGADGEAILSWGGGNVVKVQSMSVYHLNEAAVVGDAARNDMTVEQGTVFAKAKRLQTDDSYFEIKTPSAVAGVRGSEIMVAVAPTGIESFAVAEGLFAVSSATFNVDVGVDFMIVVDPEIPMPEPVPIPEEMRVELGATFRELGVVAEEDVADEADEDEEAEEEEEEETDEEAEEEDVDEEEIDEDEADVDEADMDEADMDEADMEEMDVDEADFDEVDADYDDVLDSVTDSIDDDISDTTHMDDLIEGRGGLDLIIY